MTALTPVRERRKAGDWWASLAHGGMLISPAKLREHFDGWIDPLRYHLEDRLRTDVNAVRDGGEIGPLLDTVLEGVLGLSADEWKKGNQVGSEWTRTLVAGDRLRPRRVWTGPNDVVLPVFVDTETKRLGVGRGRRTVSRVVEWLRRAERSVALVTNGQQWRLLYAGVDSDAWCEWDVALWFEEGEPGPQVDALRALLSRNALTPPEAGATPPLLAAISATRKGQAELSADLGERVRRAVELLVRESSNVLEPLDQPGPDRVDRRDIFIAACRIVMRCVVVLFAEARGLLPRENEIYEGSYGLHALRQELDRRSGGRARERLRHSYGAWPRLVSLFRLIYGGSAHEQLPILRYGGGLFKPGAADSDDGILRALSAFESADNAPSDAAVHDVLELLTTCRVKVRQGNRSTWVVAPVDFSDLSSEYIGILYEGLLDFELRRAPEDEPYVFLAVGDEPALPFDRLNLMTERQMKELFEKLRTSTSTSDVEEVDEETSENAELEGEAAELEAEAVDTAIEDAPEEIAGDLSRAQREAVQIWAEKAVVAAGIVRPLRNDTDPARRGAWQRLRATEARRLVRRVVLSGEWFLVRWGGTRKGSGTFYTRPQLAIPTVWRTLQPLAYKAAKTERDEKTGLETVVEWQPKTPEEILALKVCDPAMGSGSFLVAALRFLTQALVESLHVHGRLATGPNRTVVRLADGIPDDDPRCETLPVPQDHPDFEDRLRARLKRYVVERCIYGVDFDPLAVELGRLALWVETMDRSLPFEFLDHKLKCGNALVGCWFDQFRDYPVLAWEREGGDKDHSRGVHFAKGSWTAAIKSYRNEQVREALRSNPEQGSLFEGWAEQTPESLHDDALAAFDDLHRAKITDPDEREAIYRERILGSEKLGDLRHAFDLWCAIWFWPADRLDVAPLPNSLTSPSTETLDLASDLTRVHRFFHWELEFPDVFAAVGGGFDAICGNPPWETKKPNSMEFFSNIDPLYRTYGKQEAVEVQRQIFERSQADEREWLLYSSDFKNLSNWSGLTHAPWGDPDDERTPNCNPFKGTGSRERNGKFHSEWRKVRRSRTGYADPSHPYRLQGGGDVNTYKLFLELSHTILHDGGSLGMLVPSGIYTDNGTKDLRDVFLRRCAWTSIYAFQNERFVFGNIDHRFKIAVVHLRKGDITQAIRTRFRLGPGDSPEIQELESDLFNVRSYLLVPASQITRFSPKSGAILELRSERDLEITEKLYTNGVLLGDESPSGWGIEYATELHMTGDSAHFPPRPKWEDQGYAPDEYGHWLKGRWQPFAATETPKDQ